MVSSPWKGQRNCGLIHLYLYIIYEQRDDKNLEKTGGQVAWKFVGKETI